MAPKLAPPAKGGATSNVKVTPSPPRYKEGEVSCYESTILLNF